MDRRLSRFGTGAPDEVAALVAFLVGDDASYMSGQLVSINRAKA